MNEFDENVEVFSTVEDMNSSSAGVAVEFLVLGSEESQPPIEPGSYRLVTGRIFKTVEKESDLETAGTEAAIILK